MAYATMNGMNIRIDRAGRIVLPKPVRDRFGLKAGADLELQESAEGLLLRPVSKHPSLARAGRFLIHTGKAPAGFDILRAIDEDREERIKKLAGL